MYWTGIVNFILKNIENSSISFTFLVKLTAYLANKEFINLVLYCISDML
jgi:hypothetical protein